MTADGPVVVGVDGTDTALRAVRWAADTARRHRARLHVVHAAGFPDLYVGEGMPPPQAVVDELREHKWAFLHEARRVAADTAPGLDVHTCFDPDPPIPRLVHESGSARMIVLGASGHSGLMGLLVGSTTLALVSHARCPVVSVRGDSPEDPVVTPDDDRPVVVGVDGSPLSERAIGAAFDEACFRGVELVAVHTWSDADTELYSEARMAFDWEPLRDTEQRRLSERLAGWRERYPDVAVQRVLVKDRPRHELLSWSRRAQLIVVGSHGRGGFRGMLLGSTSQALIHNAACPVMIARPDAT